MIDFNKCEFCDELKIEFRNLTGAEFPCSTSMIPKCEKGAFYTDSEGIFVVDENKCKSNEVRILGIKVTGCKDCPYCNKTRTYGNDGRDGSIVYVCDKGAFGNIDDVKYYGFPGYATGPRSIPRYPGRKCPLFNTTPIRSIASKLDMDEKELKNILESEDCEIIFKK